jgi:secondary thiamine-phosphate synthase enzyme
MFKFDVKTIKSVQTIDITREVKDAVAGAGMACGAVLVWCPHTTSGIFCNEGADPSVVVDVETTLAKLLPPCAEYTHAEGNSHAHIRSILVGNSLVLPVENGELKLGTWQHVFYAEFDGPRTRQVWVQTLKC